MEIQYIGKNYICETEEETRIKKQNILDAYDEYQIRKLEFLNETYDSENTMISYWVLYMNNLHYDEINKGKDLLYFSTEELKILLASSYCLDTTKASMGSFLSKYCKWAENKNIININPYVDIKMSEIKSNSKRFLEQKLYGQDMFFDLCEEMAKQTKLPNIIPFILARYGVLGENLYRMRHLKWEDIDYGNKVVYIKNEMGKILTVLPVDNKFLKWIDRARLYSESAKGDEGTRKNIIKYIDYGYVLKKAMVDKKDEDPINKYNTIYNRANAACSSIGIKRIGFKDLERSRQLELLLDKRKECRLTMSDFEEIIELFSLEEEFRTDNRTYTLKRRYIELTADIVITERKEYDFPLDENHFEVANKIIQDLGLDIDENHIEEAKIILGNLSKKKSSLLEEVKENYQEDNREDYKKENTEKVNSISLEKNKINEKEAAINVTIGLEYIGGIYGRKIVDIAKELGVSRQMVHAWVSELSPIASRHLPNVSNMFPDIPIEYFSKPVSDMEKLEIQYFKLIGDCLRQGTTIENVRKRLMIKVKNYNC